MRIKIKADYFTSGLWDEDEGVMINPEELEISSNLKDLLREWIDLFESRLNFHDPNNSPVLSNDDKKKYNELEDKTFKLIENELGSKHELNFISSKFKLTT